MSIEEIVKLLEGDFGKGAVMVATTVPERVDTISTSVAGIDYITGVGGIPRGRITEIYGVEASGKSTLALSITASAQAAGGVAAYVDAEHSLDPLYAVRLGVQLNDLLISQPDSAEQALDITEGLIRTGEVTSVVIDSTAALVPNAELEGDMSQQLVGLQPRLISKALRKLSGVTSKSNTALVFINQLRHKVGVMYGNPETTPGGMAMKYYASLRLELRRGETIGKDTEQEGFHCRIKTVKNKLAPPYKQITCPILYGTGFDRIASLVDVAILKSLIDVRGSFYTVDGTTFRGKNALATYFKENEESRMRLQSALSSV